MLVRAQRRSDPRGEPRRVGAEVRDVRPVPGKDDFHEVPSRFERQRARDQLARGTEQATVEEDAGFERRRIDDQEALVREAVQAKPLHAAPDDRGDAERARHAAMKIRRRRAGPDSACHRPRPAGARRARRGREPPDRH